MNRRRRWRGGDAERWEEIEVESRNLRYVEVQMKISPRSEI